MKTIRKKQINTNQVDFIITKEDFVDCVETYMNISNSTDIIPNIISSSMDSYSKVIEEMFDCKLFTSDSLLVQYDCNGCKTYYHHATLFCFMILNFVYDYQFDQLDYMTIKDIIIKPHDKNSLLNVTLFIEK